MIIFKFIQVAHCFQYLLQKLTQLLFVPNSKTAYALLNQQTNMQSQRVSVKNNLQVYEGQFVHKFILGCIKQTCYVMLKKGTIYVYNSKRSCLNEPQKPKVFFNLNLTKIIRNGHFLVLQDNHTKMSLWSQNQQEVSRLQENANFNKGHLDPQKVFPKKFVQLNSRIDEKLKFQQQG